KLHRLTTDGKFKRDLAWSPDGTALYFCRQDTTTLLAVWKLTLAGGGLERWHPDQNTSEYEPAFSQDGKWCACVQSRANLQLKLVIESVPAGKQAVFDPGGGFAGLRHPAFSPDGSRVVFSMPATGGQQLISVDTLAKDRRDLTATVGINNHPAFSPDGRRLAFSSSRDGDFEIYIMSADGTEPVRITRSPGMDLRPVWHPDGKRLAFVSNRDGNFEIYLMRDDGGELRNLTNHPDRDDFPAWHPDGARLAFISERDGQYDLFLAELD
ncbi:MAG: hypothetical protein NT069_13345, partial [Planctomycetota bacterium]|nr:hypothetical protein [Planctomycetota bacterium]